MLSHSIFGSSDRPSARKMRAAHDLVAKAAPEPEPEGEMQGAAALLDDVRRHYLPGTSLAGSAKLLVMPSLDAANIALNLLKITGGLAGAYPDAECHVEAHREHDGGGGGECAGGAAQARLRWTKKKPYQT